MTFDPNDSDEVRSHKEAGLVKVQFISWPMIRYKREVVYSWITFVAAMGAILSFFLGINLLSTSKFIYFCCKNQFSKKAD